MHCVFVLKKELLKLPFFGWALAAMRHISIDRTAGRQALDQVVDQGRDRLAMGYYVIVFPGAQIRSRPEATLQGRGGAYLASHVGCKGGAHRPRHAGELGRARLFQRNPVR